MDGEWGSEETNEEKKRSGETDGQEEIDREKICRMGLGEK